MATNKTAKILPDLTKTEPEVPVTVETKTESKRKPVRSIERSEIDTVYKNYFDCAGGSKTKVFRYFFVQGYSVNDVFQALSKSVFPNLIYQHVRNEYGRWKSSPKK